MSPRTWQERIGDILLCARNIEHFTNAMDFDAFIDDPRTIRAVAFEFTTMGEAARAMPLGVQERYPQIPWGKCRASATCLCTNISGWMKKFFGGLHKKIFQP